MMSNTGSAITAKKTALQADHRFPVPLANALHPTAHALGATLAAAGKMACPPCAAHATASPAPSDTDANTTAHSTTKCAPLNDQTCCSVAFRFLSRELFQPERDPFSGSNSLLSGKSYSVLFPSPRLNFASARPKTYSARSVCASTPTTAPNTAGSQWASPKRHRRNASASRAKPTAAAAPAAAPNSSVRSGKKMPAFCTPVTPAPRNRFDFRLDTCEPIGAMSLSPSSFDKNAAAMTHSTGTAIVAIASGTALTPIVSTAATFSTTFALPAIPSTALPTLARANSAARNAAAFLSLDFVASRSSACAADSVESVFVEGTNDPVVNVC
mmetsp:Transcript_9649/g.31907  ORF Transcript_9649/g.31907 Transcript_9649/m.31907 type:complete len:328 (-) Transcript_9649:1184-2167(-)